MTTKYYMDPRWLLDEIKLVQAIANAPTPGGSGDFCAGYYKGIDRAISIMLDSITDALEEWTEPDANKFVKEITKEISK